MAPATRVDPAELAAAVPFAPWAEVADELVGQWAQGEHFTILGPTGEGKTHLEIDLLERRAKARRSHTVFLETKPKDATISGLGWPIIRKREQWPPGYGQTRVVVWPPYGRQETHVARQRAVFKPVLDDIFHDGHRTVAFDELTDFSDHPRDGGYGLSSTVSEFYRKGRSNGITTMGTTQRPRNAPRAAFSECRWFASFIITDDDDLRRVGELGGRVDKAVLRAVIRSLGEHEFVLVRVRSGEAVRSRVER